jgi:hypothetical protein
MKFFTCILLLVLCAPITGRANKTDSTAALRANWPVDTVVKVHFVRDLFTSEQTGAVREAMEAWTRVANQIGVGVKFTYAGETEGLIDCQGCLTISRLALYTNLLEREALLKPMRLDDSGQIFSAWMGFDLTTTNPEVMGNLMVRALGSGMGFGKSSRWNKAGRSLELSASEIESVRRAYQLRRQVGSAKPIA